MLNTKEFEVSLIIINYNSSSYTINCIKSIIEKTNVEINYQLVIVDNFSKIDDFQKLKTFCDTLSIQKHKLVRNTINSGFGSGNMLGVAHSSSEYYAFINNDSLLLNDCITYLLKALKDNQSFGVCGPQAYKQNLKMLTVLDHFISPTKEFFGRSFLEKINSSKYPNRKKEYQYNQQAQFISGSFIMVRAEDFLNIGGFDKNIFLYYEETDLCIRMLNMHKKTFLIPEAKYIHFHGASTPKNIDIKIELKISYLYVIKKHYGNFWHKVILNKLRFQYLLKSIVKPDYWKIFVVLKNGATMSYSLKHKQTEKE